MEAVFFKPRSDRDFDVVALGEALIEFNQVQSEPPMYLQGFGGDTSNAIIAAARVGARTAYLSRLGADRWADQLLALWQAEGVDGRWVHRIPGQSTGIYFVHHDRQGHHFSYARADSAASRMEPEDLRQGWRDAIAASQWLHVSGISLAISQTARDTVLQAMRFARSVGTRVSLDTNLRLSLWPLDLARSTLIEAMGWCDLMMPSLDDLVHLSGDARPEANLDWCHQHGAATVTLKMGAEGAWVSNGSGRIRIEGRVVDAVDATGAGDCFCGNVLARLVHGDDLLKASHWANLAASLSVQGHGAIDPMPRGDQVRALIT